MLLFWKSAKTLLSPSFIAIYCLAFCISKSIFAETGAENRAHFSDSEITQATQHLAKLPDCLSSTTGCRPQVQLLGRSFSRCIYHYSSMSEIRDFRKNELQDIIQIMVDRVYKTGFKHLGDSRDFDHCHLLMGQKKGKKKSFAALCHTQEKAAENQGTDFGYINLDARNWIVWLDGPNRGQVENAKKYRVDGTRPEWKDWDRFGTIPPTLLDDKKLGFKQVSEDIEFVFTKTDCVSLPKDVKPKSNLVEVKHPEQKSFCLFLENIKCSSTMGHCDASCLEVKNVE